MSKDIKQFREKVLELLEMLDGLEVGNSHEKRSIHEAINLLEKGLHSFEEEELEDFVE